MMILVSLLLLSSPPVVALAPESGAPARIEVVVVLAPHCPLARLYANRLNELAERYPQIDFRGISANEQDSEGIAEFGGRLRFAFRQDPETLARLAATRSPEAFLLVKGEVVYQGRIDDQYTPGTNRSQPTRRDLEEAIGEVLAGRSVSVPKTAPAGCLISVPKQPTGEITFEHVAPIFYGRCAVCHRPGEVAPFPLLTRRDAVNWKDMIREVVESGRMPPWHADPRYGKFSNDRSLTEREKELLIRWIDAGAPAGDKQIPPPVFKGGWSIRPDIVLTMREPFHVPAEGVLDYQDFVVQRFAEETWVRAVEIRPGNRAVVHHITALTRPAGGDPNLQYLDAAKDEYFAIMGPGNAVTVWPAGVAKVIPAGWELVLQVHYQPNGTAQIDQSSIGLALADRSTVRRRAATRPMIKPDIHLPPHTVTTLTNVWRLEEDTTMLSLVPHMHLRGRSMRVEADGEVLLHVPHYDFNWQHRYIFAEPKALPRGTVITATAVFDNTASNPNNPDPSAWVRLGKQSADEMFQLNWDTIKTREDRLTTALHRTFLIAAALCASLLLVARVRCCNGLEKQRCGEAARTPRRVAAGRDSEPRPG
jgi:hypothetical protein